MRSYDFNIFQPNFVGRKSSSPCFFCSCLSATPQFLPPVSRRWYEPDGGEIFLDGRLSLWADLSKSAEIFQERCGLLLNIPFGKLTVNWHSWLEYLHFDVRNTSSTCVHFPASYVSLPEWCAIISNFDWDKHQKTPARLRHEVLVKLCWLIGEAMFILYNPMANLCP